MAKKNNTKKSVPFSTLVVIFSILIIIAFTLTVLYLSLNDKTVPDSLITCVFIFFGTELISIAGIKISKVKNNYESSFGENVNNFINTEDEEEIYDPEDDVADEPSKEDLSDMFESTED